MIFSNDKGEYALSQLPHRYIQSDKSYRPKIKREKTIQDNEYNSGLAV
jgi:hypothetical protein